MRVPGVSLPRGPVAIAATILILPAAWAGNYWMRADAHARWADAHARSMAHWREDLRFSGGRAFPSPECGPRGRERSALYYRYALSATPMGGKGWLVWYARWCVTATSVSRPSVAFEVSPDASGSGNAAGHPPVVAAIKSALTRVSSHATYRWVVSRAGCESCRIAVTLELTPRAAVLHMRHLG